MTFINIIRAHSLPLASKSILLLYNALDLGPIDQIRIQLRLEILRLRDLLAREECAHGRVLRLFHGPLDQVGDLLRKRAGHAVCILLRAADRV